jgi:perosamine synthetase
VILQEEAEWATSSWWMTTLRIDAERGVGRDELATRLRADGVDSRPAFVPLHLLPHLRQDGALPVAEAVGSEGLSLPSSTSLTASELEWVIGSVRGGMGCG